jgi:uncharacterized protein
MDMFGNQAERDPVSPFIELLWERGQTFEQEVIEGLELPFVNLKVYPYKEREGLTMDAITAGKDLIYGGRIHAGDLLGEPDLLRREGNGYVAGDIKSGAGVESGSEDTDGKPKKHYAVQLALYTDILERLGFSAGRFPFVWDVHGEEVPYELDAPQGPRTPTTFWNGYESYLESARMIIAQSQETLPALSARCKLCHWRTVCKRKLKELDDLTLIPGLGRSRRNSMLEHINNVKELAKADLSALIMGRKTVIPRIGVNMLKRFQARAELLTLTDAEPYLVEPIELPSSELELFFDVETDPMRDICYLHGFAERRSQDNKTEKYVSFFASEPTSHSEEQAFAQAWAYIQKSQPCAIYYYSPYEKTILRKLQKRYPHVASESDIEDLFASDAVVDLYHDVVHSGSVWPTNDLSIKTLALYLGFKWRDPEPSGAASIEWYHRWVETGDPKIRQRIHDYNHDDCKATRVLLDAIRKLRIR